MSLAEAFAEEFPEPQAATGGDGGVRQPPAAAAPPAAEPEREAGGVKFDCGKPTFDLLPLEALVQVQRVLDFGAQKYSPWNWWRGMKWLRLWNAAIRHLWAWVIGEDMDPETGLSHLAHAACCILFLLAYESAGRGEDDRRKR